MKCEQFFFIIIGVVDFVGFDEKLNNEKKTNFSHA